MRSRAALGWLALVLGVLVVGLLVVAPGRRNDRPLHPEATGPAGARAVVLLVERLGGAVVVRPTPPAAADTALLLSDELDEARRADLLAWVRAGGVLVVADPSSPLADRTRGGCPEAVRDVEVLRISPNGAVERGTDCFGGNVRSRRLGDGHVVSVGSPSVFINSVLARDDNAVLAAALLVPTGRERVVFVHGGLGGGDQQLFDLLGPRVAQSLAQLAVATVAYVLWRGRRLGRPVAERQPVRVAGSELVAAVGRLLGARKRPGDAAATLRQALVRDLEVRMGVAPGAPSALAAAVAGRTGLDPAWVEDVLVTRPVVGEGDLVDLARDLDRIRDLALGPGAPVEPEPQPEGALP